MIGQLTGLVGRSGEDWVIIDVHGVGYLVHAGRRTLSLLPEKGGSVSLLIETYVRDDRMVLYGFGSVAEQAWFRLLLGVQGVGPRVALAVLGTLPPDQLSLAIAASDKKAFDPVEGVGPRLAGRIISELAGKGADLPSSAPTAPAGAAGGRDDGSQVQDVVSALANLGYGRSEALIAVERARGRLGEAAAFEDLVRAGLKELAG